MFACALQPMSCCEASGGFLSLQIHFVIVTTLSASDANKQCGCEVPTMVLSETSWPIAFSGCPRGHMVYQRLAVLGAHSPPERACGYSPSNQSVGRTEIIARNESGKKSSRPSAQAACCFRCSASKRTPFFQTSKVMAAILRAKVRRAIDGFIPRTRQAS